MKHISQMSINFKIFYYTCEDISSDSESLSLFPVNSSMDPWPALPLEGNS